MLGNISNWVFYDEWECKQKAGEWGLQLETGRRAASQQRRGCRLSFSHSCPIISVFPGNDSIACPSAAFKGIFKSSHWSNGSICWQRINCWREIFFLFFFFLHALRAKPGICAAKVIYKVVGNLNDSSGVSARLFFFFFSFFFFDFCLLCVCVCVVFISVFISHAVTGDSRDGRPHLLHVLAALSFLFFFPPLLMIQGHTE